MIQPYLPEDFDEFWAEVTMEAASEPLDFRRSQRSDFDLPGFTVEKLTLRGMHGDTLHGWLAFTAGASRLPGFLWIHHYGRSSALPSRNTTRDGFVSMSFNFFGLGAFHEEEYAPTRGYFAEGISEPKTWVFRRMIQNALLAFKVLQAQTEVDENRIGSMGISQGAGMSIWLGALCPIVKAACADLPFLTGIRYALERPVYRYPLKELTDYADSVPLGRERALHTISYFDTLNLATRCQVPTQVSVGLKDPSVRPEFVEAVYEALPGKKALQRYPGGHDWDPGMVPNNRGWLLENL